MSSAVWGARAPRSRWTPTTRGVLWAALGLILVGLLGAGLVAKHEGYRLYAVRTGSMTPGLPVGSLLVDAPPSGTYERGDVVTVNRPEDPSNPIVTHRVFSVSPAGIRTKGDANPEPDVFVAKPADVVGEVVRHVPRGGYVLVYFSQWTGVASLMTLVLTLWLAWGMCFSASPGTTSAKDDKTGTERLRVPRQRRPDEPVEVPVAARSQRPERGTSAVPETRRTKGVAPS